MLAVPMVIAGEGEGLIGVRFTRKRGFNADEQDLVEASQIKRCSPFNWPRLSRHSRQTAIVEERNRMARDMHDTLAQGFTGVIAQLEAARGAISRKKTSSVSDDIERAGNWRRELGRSQTIRAGPASSGTRGKALDHGLA